MGGLAAARIKGRMQTTEIESVESSLTEVDRSVSTRNVKIPVWIGKDVCPADMFSITMQ